MCLWAELLVPIWSQGNNIGNHILENVETEWEDELLQRHFAPPPELTEA